MHLTNNRLFSKLTVTIIGSLLCLIPEFIQSQITYQNSIYSSSIKPITIGPNQIVLQTNKTGHSTESYSTPLGTTSQDLINQQNKKAMQNMGYSPPVIPSANPTIRHQQILKEAQKVNQSKQQQQITEIKSLLQKENLPFMSSAEELLRLEETKLYRQAFSELMKMYHETNSFSLKRAVFLVENAYLDDQLVYVDYAKLIDEKVKTLKMLMKKEKISESNNLGKNYLIQKLFSEKIFADKEIIHRPYQYDFEDYLGENDWQKMFVSKLLKTGKGQCHSLPLLYLIFAKELNWQKRKDYDFVQWQIYRGSYQRQLATDWFGNSKHEYRKNTPDVEF